MASVQMLASIVQTPRTHKLKPSAGARAHRTGVAASQRFSSDAILSARKYHTVAAAGVTAFLMTGGSAFAAGLVIEPHHPSIVVEHQVAVAHDMDRLALADAPSVLGDFALAELKSKAEDVLDDARDAADDLSSSLKSGKREAKAKAEGALDDAGATAKRAARNAKVAAEDALDDAAASDVGSVVKSAARDAKEAADEFFEPVREESAKLGSSIKGIAKDAKRETAAAVERTSRQVDQIGDTSAPQGRGTFVGIGIFAVTLVALGYLARNPGEQVEERKQDTRNNRRR